MMRKFFISLPFLFQLTASLSAQHRPVWLDLEGLWRGDNVRSNSYIRFQQREDGLFEAFQFNVVGADTVTVWKAWTDPNARTPKLALIQSASGDTGVLKLSFESYKSLYWQSEQLGMEWSLDGARNLVVAIGELHNNYRYLSEVKKPVFRLSIQGGGILGNGLGNLWESHLGALKGFEAGIGLGLFGRDLPVGMSVECTAHRLQLRENYLYMENQVPYLFDGLTRQEGFTLALVPQVFIDRKKSFAVQAGVIQEINVKLRFSMTLEGNAAGTAIPSFPEPTPQKLLARAYFAGFSWQYPFKSAFKPYLYGRIYSKGLLSFGLGLSISK